LSALAEYSKNDLELVNYEAELLGFNHFELGADFLAKWNYPPAVEQAIRNCPKLPLEYARPLGLGVAVKVGSMLADSNHFAMPGAVETEDSTPDLLGMLHIANPAKFLEAFQREWQAFHESSPPPVVNQTNRRTSLAAT